MSQLVESRSSGLCQSELLAATLRATRKLNANLGHLGKCVGEVQESIPCRTRLQHRGGSGSSWVREDPCWPHGDPHALGRTSGGRASASWTRSHRAVLGPGREWQLTAAQSLLAESLRVASSRYMSLQSSFRHEKSELKADDLSLHSVDDDGDVISDSPIKGSLNSGTSRNTEQSVQFHAVPTGTSDVVAFPE